MLIACIAPELIVFFVACQLSVVRKFASGARWFSTSILANKPPQNVKSRQFMGASSPWADFKLVSHAHGHPIMTIAQLKEPIIGAQYESDIINTLGHEIADKMS
ncbi:hypothetical protein B0H13DRAFT_2360848 [Mycena leptocephala]|nr:hypothetical protein B0H13DRAFT_2360848 [Mycena leptocephala]